MSTNASITVQHADTTFSTIYLHWSGHLAGGTLRRCFNTLAKATALVALGDISSLGADIADVDAYARDRGETGVEARKFATYKDLCADTYFESYNYLFINNKWHQQKYNARSNTGFAETADAGVLV